MDWNSGQVNAKYWVTNLLAATVGTKETKAFSMVKVGNAAPLCDKDPARVVVHSIDGCSR